MQQEQDAYVGGAQQLMAAPRQPPGCPPGLEYMAQVDQLLVHQQVELLEVLSLTVGNKYQIKNSLGKQVYMAREESDLSHRRKYGKKRGFNMLITDNINQEVFRIVRPLLYCAGCCCAGCCWCAEPDSTCSMYIQIESPPGLVVAYVKQAKSSCIGRWVVEDANQQLVLRIRGPSCQEICSSMVCCGPTNTDSVDYAVLTVDGSQQIGRIAKQWGGRGRALQRASDFCVQFPVDLALKLKAALVGATFLIDYMYFQPGPNGYQG